MSVGGLVKVIKPRLSMLAVGLIAFVQEEIDFS